MGRKEPTYTVDGNVNSATIMESNMEVLKTLNIEWLYDLVIPLLGMYWKEYGSGYNRVTCMPMFITAQFKIAKL
jgi:hypothetical protein